MVVKSAVMELLTSRVNGDVAMVVMMVVGVMMIGRVDTSCGGRITSVIGNVLF